MSSSGKKQSKKESYGTVVGARVRSRLNTANDAERQDRLNRGMSLIYGSSSSHAKAKRGRSR